MASNSVLIVDDDRSAVSALSDVLRNEGYAVSGVLNGAEAWNYLNSSTPPCLIVLDLNMPVMDGWEFRRRQLADAAFRAIPVVVITAAPAGGGEELSDVPVLRKPIVLEELLDQVATRCGPPTRHRERSVGL